MCGRATSLTSLTSQVGVLALSLPFYLCVSGRCTSSWLGVPLAPQALHQSRWSAASSLNERGFVWHAGSLSCPYDMGRPDDFLSHLPALQAAAAQPNAACAGSDTGSGVPGLGNGLATAEVQGWSAEACSAQTSLLREVALRRGLQSTSAPRSDCCGQAALKGLSAQPEVASSADSAGGAVGVARVSQLTGAIRHTQQRSLCVVCRRGNDSQRVVQLLRSTGFPHAMDLEGGLQAWAAVADPAFPAY